MIARQQRIQTLDDIDMDLLFGLTEPLQALMSHGELVENASLAFITAEGLGIAEDIQVFLQKYHSQGFLSRACNWVVMANEGAVQAFLYRLNGFNAGVVKYISKYLGSTASINRPERSTGLSATEDKEVKFSGIREEDRIQQDGFTTMGTDPKRSLDPSDGE